jgi:hypothetical protein
MLKGRLTANGFPEPSDLTLLVAAPHVLQLRLHLCTDNLSDLAPGVCLEARAEDNDIGVELRTIRECQAIRRIRRDRCVGLDLDLCSV